VETRGEEGEDIHTRRKPYKITVIVPTPTYLLFVGKNPADVRGGQRASAL